MGALRRHGKMARPGLKRTLEAETDLKADHFAVTPGFALPTAWRNADWSLTTTVKQDAQADLQSELRTLYQEQQQAIIDALQRIQESGRATRHVLTVYRAANSLKEDPVPALHQLIIQQLIDWEGWASELVVRTRPLFTDLMEEGFVTGANRVGVRDVDFTSDSPFARDALDRILRLAQQTQSTWERRLAERVQTGLSEGDDFADLIDRAEDLGEQQTGFRLRRNVRTAGNATFEAGQLASWREFDFVTRRSWLTERDLQVRGVPGDRWDHRSADRQIQRLEHPFWIQRFDAPGGEAVMYPAAPEASPGNAIHCRCSQVAELDE
jgi:hypothetical protein